MDRLETAMSARSRPFEELDEKIVASIDARIPAVLDSSVRQWQELAETRERISRERRSERRRWRPNLVYSYSGSDSRRLRGWGAASKLEMLLWILSNPPLVLDQGATPAPSTHAPPLEAGGPWGSPVAQLLTEPLHIVTDSASDSAAVGSDEGTAIAATLVAGDVTFVATLRQRARTVLRIWQLSGALTSATRRPRKRHCRCCAGPNWGAEVPLARLGAVQSDGAPGFAAPRPIVEAVPAA